MEIIGHLAEHDERGSGDGEEWGWRRVYCGAVWSAGEFLGGERLLGSGGRELVAGWPNGKVKTDFANVAMILAFYGWSWQ